MGDQEAGAKTMPSKAKSCLIFLCLFSLPFAGFGTFAVFKSIQFFLTPGKVKDGVMLGLFALTFSTVGYGLFFGGIAGYQAQQRKEMLRAAHPAEPWLWREDWIAGKSYASTRSLMWFIWIFALMWNGISSSVVVGLVTSHSQINLGFIVAAIFPIIGLFFLGWAVRVTILWKKFGRSTFKMLSVPGVIGGNLSGAIETSVKVRPQDGFHLRLACVNRVKVGDGKNSSTRETVLWQADKTVNEDLLDEPNRSGIPVSFQIPGEVKETDNTTPADAIVWRLIANAKVPGVDYSATFEVPVFRTAEGAAAINDEQ